MKKIKSRQRLRDFVLRKKSGKNKKLKSTQLKIIFKPVKARRRRENIKHTLLSLKEESSKRLEDNSKPLRNRFLVLSRSKPYNMKSMRKIYPGGFISTRFRLRLGAESQPTLSYNKN